MFGEANIALQAIFTFGACIRMHNRQRSVHGPSPVKNKFHLLRHTTTRHDTSTTCRASRDVSWRAVSCVLCRACSNMADDEEELVLACKRYHVLLLFIISAHKWKYLVFWNELAAIITLYTLQTNSVSYRACRARGDGRVALVALVVTRCVVLWRAVSRLLYSMHDTARTTFSYTKLHGLDSESWRVVTWRNKWSFWALIFKVHLAPTILLSSRWRWAAELVYVRWHTDLCRVYVTVIFRYFRILDMRHDTRRDKATCTTNILPYTPTLCIKLCAHNCASISMFLTSGKISCIINWLATG